MRVARHARTARRRPVHAHACARPAATTCRARPSRTSSPSTARRRRRRRSPARRPGTRRRSRSRGRGRRDAGVPARGPGPDARPSCRAPAQQSYSGLAPGSYRFVVRASDRAGNLSETVREFTVASVLPQITPTPTPTRRRRRSRSSARPPWRGRSAARCSSAARGAMSSSSSTARESIPMGSTIDAKQGRVRITAETRQGTAAAAGRVLRGHLPHHADAAPSSTSGSSRSWRRARAGPPRRRHASRSRASCGARARAGSGPPAQYSAATVRGTTWLVQDTCAGTLTRVTEGVVAVRDKRLKKTVLRPQGQALPRTRQTLRSSPIGRCRRL